MMIACTVLFSCKKNAWDFTSRKTDVRVPLQPHRLTSTSEIPFCGDWSLKAKAVEKMVRWCSSALTIRLWHFCIFSLWSSLLCSFATAVMMFICKISAGFCSSSSKNTVIRVIRVWMSCIFSVSTQHCKHYQKYLWEMALRQPGRSKWTILEVYDYSCWTAWDGPYHDAVGKS